MVRLVWWAESSSPCEVDVVGKHSDAASALCEGSVVIHCSDWKIPLGIAGSRWSYRGGGGGNCGGKGSGRF